MLNAFSAAVAVDGAVTTTATSWVSIAIALAITIPIAAFDKEIALWVRSKTNNHVIDAILVRRFGRISIQVLVGFVLIWFAIVSSNISILRPGVLVGYTDQLPFRFGRYVASVGRSPSSQDGYCPHVDLTGTVVNSSEKIIRVWYSGDAVKVWSQNPSATYNSQVELNGIGRAGGGYSDIAPGSSLRLTISADMAPALCKNYTTTDLTNLRHGRMTATTAIHVSNPDGKGDSLEPIAFQDLPIAAS